MNTFSTRTRRGAAILFSGVLILGGLTVAGEASAVKNVDDNPTCEDLGYTYGEKWEENWDVIEGDTYTLDRDGMKASLTVGTYPDTEDPNTNNAITAFSVNLTEGYAIVVKGGDGANVYRNATQTDIPLHAPAVPAVPAVDEQQKWPTISHFDLCWNTPAPAPEFGRIEVTKTVVGDPPDGASYVINVVGPTPATTMQSKTIVAGQTVIFDNLVPGTYTVTENNPGTEYTVNITPGTVEVTAGGLATVAVVNTYSEEESLPPTTPTTPTAPAAPATPAAPAAPAAPADVALQATLPATGSNGWIAALATVLVATGVALTLLSRRRGTQQA